MNETILNAPPFILRRHRLKHIPELRVRQTFFDRGFAQGCSMMQCNASCCHGGVWADPKEKENILLHRESIIQEMDPVQRHDPAQWFDDEEIADSDFPSGRAIGTQVHDDHCVFLNSAGRCVLQTAAVALGMDKFTLKPYYCVAFPITIDRGELIVDDPSYTRRTQCCSILPAGSLSVFDVCREELMFTLGAEGFRELQTLQHDRAKQSTAVDGVGESNSNT